MKGTTLAALLIVFVGIAVAYPWNERRGRISQNVAPRTSVNTLSSSPYYYYRSPRYDSQDDEEYLPSQGRRYKIYRKDEQNEESAEEEDDDDVADDDTDDDQDEDEPEDDQFDTPTWERLFPREEQGSQGQDVGPPPSGGGYEGGSQGGRGGPPPPSRNGGYPGSDAQGATYEAIIPQQGQGFGGGSPQIGGRGRSGFVGKQRIRPVAVRVIRPNKHIPVKKSYWEPAYQPMVQGHRQSQYYGQRNSRPQPYQQYVYVQPSASRRWAYQPTEQMPQYHAYQHRPVYRPSSTGPYVWGRQRRSRN